MNSRQRLKARFAGEKTDRVLFCPAIYEHKAKLIGKGVSDVSQSAALLSESTIAEYKTYGGDAVTVGIDVYNVEAEAIGCEVVYPEAADAVPSICRRAIKNLSDVETLCEIDVEKSERMPLILEAGKIVQKKLGSDVVVRGAVTGPFSMAAEMVGIEQLIIGMMTEPDKFSKLMDFCMKVSIEFGKAFIERGLSVCVFDSQATPPMISPDIYRDCVLPRVQLINNEFKAAGCEFTEYVIGGNTDAIAEYMADGGFDIVLSDFASDAELFISKAKSGQLIRRNISPILIENGPDDELFEQVRRTVELAGKYENVIIGTGVLSYNTPVDRILKVKEMCMEFGNGR